MINFTTEAFRKLESSLDPEDIIRIKAIVGGCTGVSYSIEIEAEATPEDSMVDMEAFKVCVDPYSKFILKNLKIDYVQTASGSGFKFGDEEPIDTLNCDCSRSSICG